MWCPLPWVHLSVKNNGYLRLCSHSSSKQFENELLTNNGKPIHISNADNNFINCDTLKDIRKQMLDGQWPDACSRCKKEHNSNMNSRNLWETERHKDTFTLEDAKAITSDDGSLSETNIQNLDIRLGNSCNLRCSMCHPGESTRWYQDYESITGKNYFVVDNKKYSISDNNFFNWFDNTDNVNKLLDLSNNVIKINFGGGEPFIIKKHRTFLQGLIDRGLSDKIELEYSTNLTVVPNYVHSLWPRFKEIQLHCSLDGVGAVNEAVRYPSDWNTTVNNLKILDNLSDNVFPFISTTISILNLEHYVDLQLWIDQQNYKKINMHNKYITHMVSNPKEFNYGILEEFQLARVFDLLYNKAINNKKLSLILDKFYDLYYKNKLQDLELNHSRKKFTNVFYNLEKNQNQNFKELFPLAYKSILEWNNEIT